ncbi:MAG: tetratricopeptide repeat protein [Desulfuromonadales bacterium]|nr:tetratricopeptide repeat protein [Desulfuromonadales bacterium]
MDRIVEEKIKDALKQIDSLKTPDCLNVATIGRFAEKKLEETEMIKAEAHLHTCLYCLKQLNDMTELLYYQKNIEPLSPRLAERLRNLQPGRNKQENNNKPTFLQKLKEFFSSRQWQLSTFATAGICVALLATLIVTRHTDNKETPILNTNAFVKVSALNSDGNILREEQGVVVGADGLIASNLLPLAGASKLQITLKDGKTYQTAHIWKDEDKNLAVMKIDTNNLPAIPTVDIRDISVGQRIFAVADPAKTRKGFQEAMVSDFKEIPGQRKGSEIQYIQIASQTATTARGALIDDHGRLLGFLITEEKHINLATPASNVAQLVKEGKAIPLSDLKNVTFSADALNAYMKGILASDGHRWNEAISYYKKAIKLNPRLEGAYEELGYAFYEKQDFEQEANAYKAGLKINPNNTDLLFNLAENLESRGQYDEAILMYEKALAIDPDDKELLFQLGVSYLAQGNKAKAMNLYDRLKVLDKGNAELLRRLAK